MWENNLKSHFSVRHKDKDPNIGFQKVLIDGTSAFSGQNSNNFGNQNSNLSSQNPTHSTSSSDSDDITILESDESPREIKVILYHWIIYSTKTPNPCDLQKLLVYSTIELPCIVFCLK